MDNLGLRLKTLRARRGLSQRKLAQIAGVSNATVSLIEHGRTDPSMGLLRKILDSLGMSFADFFASDTRTTEKRYAHLLPDHVAATIRAKLPTLSKEKPTVRQLKGRKK